MPRKRHKPEEIVAKLRQVDVLVSQGKASPMRSGRSASPRSRITGGGKEYGGLKRVR